MGIAPLGFDALSDADRLLVAEQLVRLTRRWIAAFSAPGSAIGPGDPAGAVKFCDDSDPGFSVASLDAEVVVFCCEEFVTGGVTSDVGTLLRVPKPGIYSVLFQASTVMTVDSVGGLVVEVSEA